MRYCVARNDRMLPLAHWPRLTSSHAHLNAPQLSDAGHALWNLQQLAFRHFTPLFVNMDECCLDTMKQQTTPLYAITHVVDSIGQPDCVKKDYCKMCSTAIEDQYTYRVGNESVHEACLLCRHCSAPLHDRCYERNCNLYCEQHYYQECSPHQCSGCKQGVSPTEMVYKLKVGVVYHIQCHKCSRCDRQLTPGDQIVVDESSRQVACAHHYYMESVSDACCSSYSTMTNLAFPMSETSEDMLSPFKECPPNQSLLLSDDAIKRDLDSPSLQYPYPFETFMYSECFQEDNKFLKRRGPRTTIKQNQLDVLNRIFTRTPKPSKHARAKLALETGLSMRVIQVWFQNRRSKERRLKHLCNYLRHYEQRGLVPPSLTYTHEGDDQDCVDAGDLNSMSSPPPTASASSAFSIFTPNLSEQNKHCKISPQ